MGTFRIEIQAVGGHGCQREVKDGELVTGCDRPSCPDCIARRCVQELKAHGASFTYGDSFARLIHWPGDRGEVKDDLLTGVRSGNF